MNMTRATITNVEFYTQEIYFSVIEQHNVDVSKQYI